MKTAVALKCCPDWTFSLSFDKASRGPRDVRRLDRWGASDSVEFHTVPWHCLKTHLHLSNVLRPGILMVVDKASNVFKASKLVADGSVRDCKFVAESVLAS